MPSDAICCVISPRATWCPCPTPCNPSVSLVVQCRVDLNDRSVLVFGLANVLWFGVTYLAMMCQWTNRLGSFTKCCCVYTLRTGTSCDMLIGLFVCCASWWVRVISLSFCAIIFCERRIWFCVCASVWVHTVSYDFQCKLWIPGTKQVRWFPYSGRFGWACKIFAISFFFFHVKRSSSKYSTVDWSVDIHIGHIPFVPCLLLERL